MDFVSSILKNSCFKIMKIVQMNVFNFRFDKKNYNKYFQYFSSCFSICVLHTRNVIDRNVLFSMQH